jgi:hypothetical protein
VSVTGGDIAAALEDRLKNPAHGAEALTIVREAISSLKSAQRQEFLNRHLLRPPILHCDIREAVEHDLRRTLDPFIALQGDIIKTEAAYTLGRRLTGERFFVVGTSTCDLLSDRRETIMLFPITPRYSNDLLSEEQKQKVRSELGSLVAFKSTRLFYLPVLEGQRADTLYNVAAFDPFAQCDNAALVNARRVNSMTLVGWRIFGGVTREILIRSGDDEVAIRTASPEALPIQEQANKPA